MITFERIQHFTHANTLYAYETTKQFLSDIKIKKIAMSAIKCFSIIMAGWANPVLFFTSLAVGIIWDIPVSQKLEECTAKFNDHKKTFIVEIIVLSVINFQIALIFFSIISGAAYGSSFKVPARFENNTQSL